MAGRIGSYPERFGGSTRLRTRIVRTPDELLERVPVRGTQGGLRVARRWLL